MSEMTGEPHRKHACFVLQVKPERLDEYRARHHAVWPEMLDALRASGWHNYSLFLRDDGLLVGYLETDDFARAQRDMAGRDVNSRWQASVRDLFEDLGDADPDQAMTPLPEIFHLATPTGKQHT